MPKHPFCHIASILLSNTKVLLIQMQFMWVDKVCWQCCFGSTGVSAQNNFCEQLCQPEPADLILTRTDIVNGYLHL